MSVEKDGLFLYTNMYDGRIVGISNGSTTSPYVGLGNGCIACGMWGWGYL